MNMSMLFFVVVIWVTVPSYSLGELKIKIPHEDLSLKFMIRLIIDITPGLNNIIVNPLNYARTNPDDFTEFVRKLNSNHETSRALVLSDKEEVSLLQEKVYVCFLNVNESQHLNQFLETIHVSKLKVVVLLIWANKYVSVIEKGIVLKKASEKNITEVIFFSLSDRQLKDDTSIQYESKSRLEEVVIGLENLALFKEKSSLSTVRYVTNQFRFGHTLQKLKKEITDFQGEYKRLPLNVLVFLQPGSIEPINSINREKSFMGANIDLLKVLSQRFNISYVLQLGNPDQFGIVSKNNSFLKAWLDLVDGVSDINLNFYPIYEFPVQEDVYMFPIFEEQFCFVMKLPQNQVRAWDVLQVFETSVWICLLCFNSFTFLVFLVLKGENWKNIWFLQSMLSAIHFQVTSNVSRIFWAFWLSYVFLVNNSFTCLFVTQLMPQSQRHQYKTLADLREGNITLLSGIGQFGNIFAKNNIENIEPFYGSFEEINETSALLTTVMARRIMTKVFGTQFYTVEECLLDNVVGPMMLKSHRNSVEIKYILEKVKEAGLYQYWVKDFLNRHVKHENNVSFLNEDRSQFSPIRVLELEYIFIYFTVALTVATMAFVCELLWSFLKTPKQKQVKKLKVYPFVK